MMRICQRSWWIVVLLLAAGCSDPNNGMVSGTVKVDGTLPKTGAIAFIPVDRKSSTSGGEIVDGLYSAKVPVGQSLVQIRVPKKVGEQKLYNTKDSPVQPILEEVLPAKYNDRTELQIDVKSGANTHDFDLKTK